MAVEAGAVGLVERGLEDDGQAVPCRAGGDGPCAGDGLRLLLEDVQPADQDERRAVADRDLADAARHPGRG